MLAAKKRPAPDDRAPSPAASIASDGPPSAKKSRKSGTPAFTPSTQFPADTGTSELAQKTAAAAFLKDKRGEPQTLEAITNWLSVRDEDRIRQLVLYMRHNPTIGYEPPGKDEAGLLGEAITPENEWRFGTYAYLAKIPGVRDKMSLLKYLQQRTEALGVPVKDVKDGWPDCDPILREMERENAVLVVRTKKDGQARQLWQDVPSLHYEVDGENRVKFHKVPVPPDDELPRKLADAGLKPSSSEARVVKPTVSKEPKKKAARKSNKMTNTHLQSLLEDFSHKGRRAV